MTPPASTVLAPTETSMAMSTGLSAWREPMARPRHTAKATTADAHSWTGRRAARTGGAGDSPTAKLSNGRCRRGGGSGPPCEPSWASWATGTSTSESAIEPQQLRL
eukprot:scaffold2191_cov138-Isochrysis_galbana.AAC.4